MDGCGSNPRSRSGTDASNYRKAFPIDHYTWQSPFANDTPRGMNSSALPPRPSLIRQSSVASSRNSSNAVQDKFAELRDAAFYNTDVPGFLLSADERLCYPYVYSGKVPEDPVEVEDIDSFLLENWDLWDEDHTRKLTIEEYPTIILSRERKQFQAMRIGILREGRRGVYDCRGQPLYSPRTGEFLGGIVYVVELGSVEAIQARKAEEQLKSFEAICDSLPHIVWSADAHGKIDYFSRAWYDYSGLSEQESMGHGWRQAMHPDDHAESWQALDTAGRVVGQTDSTYRCRRHDGVYRWFHARAAPKLDSDGKIIRFYGTSTDVHDTILAKEETRQLERENARLISTENAAREGSRMKSQFLAHMSHELRTPIAGIIGMVSLLRDTRLSVDQADYADCIKTSAQNLLTIVNDVLDFSKIESGRLEIETIQFDITGLVDDFRRVWTLMANQKGISFNVTTNLTGSLEIMGDPTRIGQILSNLLSNAAKFTSSGSISFSAQVEEQNGNLFGQLMVIDTGVGMNEKTLASLFTPFRQGDTSTARLYGGTGLGLTISRNLAHLMGGQLTLESTAGVGTRATLNLPLKRPAPVAAPTPQFNGARTPIQTRSVSAQTSLSTPATPGHLITPTKGISKRPTTRRVQTSVDALPRQSTLQPSSPSPLTARPTDDPSNHPNFAATDPTVSLPLSQRNKIAILIIEDNVINQRIATKTVQKLGFTATAADNGKEALDFVLQNPVDIILSDCQMPLMDGYEFTRAIRTSEPWCSRALRGMPGIQEGTETPLRSSTSSRKTLKDIPIIALTASAIPGDQAKCYDAGMSDYITKPLDAKILEMKLVKWAFGGGGSAVSGNLGVEHGKDGMFGFARTESDMVFSANGDGSMSV